VVGVHETQRTEAIEPGVGDAIDDGLARRCRDRLLEPLDRIGLLTLIFYS